MPKCMVPGCGKEIRFGQDMVKLEFGKYGRMLESGAVYFHHQCLKKKKTKIKTKGKK